MDHDATREQLELAAVEPGGLERLIAGDTPSAQAVAAHLAGCPSCTDELARLQRAAVLIRGTLREMPASDLKTRTLAAIRVEGVPRPLAAAAQTPVAIPVPVPLAPPSVLDAPSPAAPVAPDASIGHRRSAARLIGWAATVAAAVVLSVIVTSMVVGARVDEQLASQAEVIAALEHVTSATLTVTAQPDAEHVALVGVTDPKLDGSLTFSPSTSELVVVAAGLTPPPAGQEYRCWVEVGGMRHRVGKMFFSPDLAFWVGPAPAISGVSSGATFGISLVGADGPSVDATPVLVGEL